MKKTLIIVVLIALGILGTFMFLGKSIDQKQEEIQVQLNEARTNAKQAAFKAFVAGSIGDLATNYSEGVLFKDNAKAKQAVELRFAALQEKYPGNYSYLVYDEKENAAVKLLEADSGFAVCIDSVTVKVTEIKGEQFNQKTDCSGQVLN